MISFDWPWVFLLLPLIVLFWFLYKKRYAQSIEIASGDFVIVAENSLRLWLIKVWPYLLLFILAMLIVVMAKPQIYQKKDIISKEGLDIVISLDVSQSMLIEDLTPQNRLEVAKQVAIDFVGGRSNDRIAMVVFAEEGFVQCPLTVDYEILKKLIADIQTGTTSDGNATAIGSAIAVSLNRLRSQQTKASSKVIILLTDGESNAGQIEPLDAANMAAALGVRIYTVGVGKKGPVKIPMKSIFGTFYQTVQVKIDEELLTKISETTGGLYFRATDKDTLANIFQEIAKLEKSKVESQAPPKRHDIGYLFLFFSAGMFLLFIILDKTYLKRLP